MPKQHEILAIKSGVVGKFAKLKADLIDLFVNKKLHFSKIITVFKPVAEGAPDVTEQNTEMQTTVHKELAWIGVDFAKVLDLCHTINLTNCIAKADVSIGELKLLTDIPATGLLELEKYIVSFKELVEKVPTLDPVKGFTVDSANNGWYKAQDRVTSRTAKEPYVLTLAAATDKHPAQAVEKSRDVVTGNKHEQEWSGMLTPSEKSKMISRCEDLITAIKAAQSRANNTETKSAPIGDSIVKYLLGN